MSISLQQHLQSSDTAHCSLAIDLCWRGVAIWKKFVSLTNIFRTLVALAFPSEDESNSPTWENRKQARPAILEIAQRSSSSFMRTLISELGNFSSPVLRKLGSLVRFLAEKVSNSHVTSCDQSSSQTRYRLPSSLRSQILSKLQ